MAQKTPLSRHPALYWATNFFGLVGFGFGVSYIVRPRQTYAMFGLPYPTTPTDLRLMDAVCTMFGAKDLLWGSAIWASNWFGTRRSTGIILLVSSIAAGIDGSVVNGVTGTGQWDHWGYGIVMGFMGLVMCGLFD